MTGNTPIQTLVRDRIGDNTSRGLDNVPRLPVVVDYLRLICPTEDDLLLFTTQERGATDTGRLFAVTRTHAAILQYGYAEGGIKRFSISGPVLPLATVSAVKFLPESTAWSNPAGPTIDPAISVEFKTGESVSLGRDAEFGWAGRGQPDLEAETDARTELLARLLA